MIKNFGIVITAASAAAQKLGYSTFKAKCCDGDREPYAYDEVRFIFSITSLRYGIAKAKTQWRFSIHCCTCITMRIPPTTVMQLSRSLEIPMAQVVDALVP